MPLPMKSEVRMLRGIFIGCRAKGPSRRGRFYSVTRRSCFGEGALAELTTGALILVVGAVFTLLGLLFFPFLCLGVPLLVVGLILVVVEGGETRKQPVYGYPAYYPYPTLPPGTPIPRRGKRPVPRQGPRDSRRFPQVRNSARTVEPLSRPASRFVQTAERASRRSVRPPQRLYSRELLTGAVPWSRAPTYPDFTRRARRIDGRSSGRSAI